MKNVGYCILFERNDEKSKIKNIVRQLLPITAVIVWLSILHAVTGELCIIKVLFDVSCPTCGTTRALLALCRGDVLEYMDYNALAVTNTVAFVCVVLGVGKRSKVANTVYILYALVVLTYYVYRIIIGALP